MAVASDIAGDTDSRIFPIPLALAAFLPPLLHCSMNLQHESVLKVYLFVCASQFFILVGCDLL